MSDQAIETEALAERIDGMEERIIRAVAAMLSSNAWDGWHRGDEQGQTKVREALVEVGLAALREK